MTQFAAQGGNPVSSQLFGQSSPSLNAQKQTLLCVKLYHFTLMNCYNPSCIRAIHTKYTHMLLDKPSAKVFSSLGCHIRWHGIPSPHSIVPRVSSYQSLRDTSSSLSRFPLSPNACLRVGSWMWSGHSSVWVAEDPEALQAFQQLPHALRVPLWQ